METKILRAAILGTGFMGGVHGRSLMALPGVELAALCGTTVEKADALIQNLGSDAAAYDDFDRMLNEVRPDALFVCLPPFTHQGYVERAAARGAALFLEKPLALTEAESEAMAEAVRRAGVISQVGYHYRFKKSVRRLLELIESGAAGRPTLFQGRFWCRMDGAPWWRRIDGSGGQLYEQAIHLYDLALAFLGTPKDAWGLTANLLHRDRPDYTIEDTSAGMVRFENGALAAITASNGAVPDRFMGDFRVAFENAVLEYRSMGDWRQPDQAALWIDGREESFVEDGNPYQDEAAHFLDCVRRKTPTGIAASVGLTGVRLVSAVLRSAARGGAPTPVKETSA